MHVPARAKYPFVAVTEALMRVLTLKQQENELVVDYARRFKQAMENLKAYMGAEMLDGFVTQTEEYTNGNEAKKSELKKNGFETWMSYLLLRGSDPKKYAKLLHMLQSQYALQTNQYPTTVKGASEALLNHHWDQAPKRSNTSGGDNKKKDEKTKTEKSFAQSGKTGKGKAGDAKKNNSDIWCYACGEDGHAKPDCTKDIPKDKWFVNVAKKAKGKQMYQSEEKNDEKKEESETAADSAHGHRPRAWLGSQLPGAAGKRKSGQ